MIETYKHFGDSRFLLTLLHFYQTTKCQNSGNSMLQSPPHIPQILLTFICRPLKSDSSIAIAVCTESLSANSM